jgi:type VI protein secretion system component VasF
LKQKRNPAAKANTSALAPSAPAASPDRDEQMRLKHARNRANTIRNAAKVEHFLMEVEKMQGFAKSWSFRERLEQGHVSLDELMHR